MWINSEPLHSRVLLFFSFFFSYFTRLGMFESFVLYIEHSHINQWLGRRPHIFGVSKWDFPAFAISNDLHSTGTEVCVCVYTWALSCIYHFNYLQMLMVVWKLGVMVQSQMTRLQLVTERCVWFVTCCTVASSTPLFAVLTIVVCAR